MTSASRASCIGGQNQREKVSGDQFCQAQICSGSRAVSACESERV